MSRGMPSQTTAEKLGLTASTVKTHVQHIFVKLGGADRAEAIGMAGRRGCRSPESVLRHARNPRTNSQGSTPSAAAICTTFSRPRLRSPRSTPPMYVRCRSATSASRSCVKPSVTRRRRTRRPNSTSTGDSFLRGATRGRLRCHRLCVYSRSIASDCSLVRRPPTRSAGSSASASARRTML